MKRRAAMGVGMVLAMLLAPLSARAGEAAIELVSILPDGRRTTSGYWVTHRTLSADGRIAVFHSAVNGGDYHIYVRDRSSGTTQLVTMSDGTPMGGAFAELSANGRLVSATYGTHFWIRDLNGDGEVSVRVPYPSQVWRVGLSDSLSRYVLVTDAPQLTGVSSPYAQVVSPGMEPPIVSASPLGEPGNAASSEAAITPDGRYVIFVSMASNLVPNDTNNASDVFVRDLDLGTTRRVSVSSDGDEANGYNRDVGISRDGHLVTFASSATNLVPGDTNVREDVFVHGIVTHVTTRVSSEADGRQLIAGGLSPGLSLDGSTVAFSTEARLVAEDIDTAFDVYVRRLSDGALERISRTVGTWESAGDAYMASLSADGSQVSFISDGTNLIEGGTPYGPHTYVRDRAHTPPPDGDPVDVQAPTTTIQISPEDGWTSSQVRVTFSCADDRSGCRSTRYKVDDWDWSPVAEPSTGNYFHGEGRYLLAASSTDFAGNEEPAVTREFGIDKSPPTAEMEPRVGVIIVSPSFASAFVATAQDQILQDGAPGSGVTKVCFNVAPVSFEGEEHRCAFTATRMGDRWVASPLGLERGLYRVSATSTDLVGNEGPDSPQILVFVIDTH